MKVYRSFPLAIEPGHVDDGYWHHQPNSITIHTDDTQRHTGLLDLFGNKIMSCEVIGPVGFNRS